MRARTHLIDVYPALFFHDEIEHLFFEDSYVFLMSEMRTPQPKELGLKGQWQIKS